MSETGIYAGEGGGKRGTYTMVNKGETSEPSRADRAAELWDPPSAGAIESVQMPHQHKILYGS